MLTFGAPAGHDTFFRLAGDREPVAGPLDMERMAHAAQAACVELLGPPPFEMA